MASRVARSRGCQVPFVLRDPGQVCGIHTSIDGRRIDMSKYAVLGSGEVGRVLADGLLAHEHEVMRASRDPGKLAPWRRGAGARASVGTFAEAARWGEQIVLAVKGAAAEQALELAGIESLAGKVVIDATNPIADTPPQNGVLRFFTNLDESLMERLQRKAPAVRFVKAFSCVGSPFMVHPQFPGGPPSMFICGNDDRAKGEVGTLLTELGWETVDMGTVEAARAIEPLCILWCIPGLTRQRWTHAFKLLQAG
jgi:predicted dinucleotide-binding enzyme